MVEMICGKGVLSLEGNKEGVMTLMKMVVWHDQGSETESKIERPTWQRTKNTAHMDTVPAPLTLNLLDAA